MNGIDFFIRDRSGWIPPVPLPRLRFKWDAQPDPLSAEEVEFIRSVKGRISERELAECYGVSHTTIHNIQHARHGW